MTVVLTHLFKLLSFFPLIWVRGHSRLLKLAPFKSLGTVSYLPSIVTMAVSIAICEIFSVKEWCDLENRVRVCSKFIG